MSVQSERLEESRWDEFVRLSRKSALLSVGLSIVVLIFHQGFPIRHPELFQLIAGLSVAYFGALRYFLARTLLGPQRRHGLLANFFKFNTLAQGAAWGFLINTLSAWTGTSPGPVLLSALLMAGIPAAASNSLHLRPKIYIAYLICFFATSLGYFHFVGGHSHYPYLSPIAITYMFYLIAISKTQAKMHLDILQTQTTALHQHDTYLGILNEASFIFALCNTEGRFQFVNKGFEETFGIRNSDIAGFPIQRVLDQNTGLQVPREFVKSQKITDEQAVMLKKGNVEHKFWLVQKKLHNAEQILFCWFPLSPYENLKALDSQKEHEAIEAKKLLILSEFSGHVFRDINKPLAQIWGYTRRLEKSPAALKIEAPLLKLVNLAKSLRSMGELKSAISQVETKGFKVGELIERCVNDAKSAFENAQIPLEIKVDEPEIFVLGSILWVEQIVNNLLINSLDAVKGKPNPHVKIEVARIESCVEIWVHDSGKLLDIDMQAKIFEPFFTTKAPGEGMGMGLSLSRELATRIEGSLNFKQTPEGTNGFALSLKSLVAQALEQSEAQEEQKAS